MRISIVALFVCLPVLCTACDTFSGVSRTASIAQLPHARIEQVLSRVPGVTSIRREHVPQSVAWSLYQGKVVSPAYDRYLYSAGEVGGVVEFRQRPEVGNELEIYYWWFNRQMPARTADEARRVMDAVYEALRQEFPGIPEKSAVLETQMRLGP